MKVNAINGINQSVSFEKRSKRADKAQAQHQTNPMKAVPLAVLIAMSPLNAPAQNASAQTSSATKTEQVAQPAEKVLQALKIENASPRFGDCILELVSTDGDDNFSEKVSLTFDDDSYFLDHSKRFTVKIDELNKKECTIHELKQVLRDNHFTDEDIDYILASALDNYEEESD